MVVIPYRVMIAAGVLYCSLILATLLPGLRQALSR
jgi:hypothetical protein